MLLLLLMGLSIGLMTMVNTEVRAGSSDAQNSLAYHQAEGGIERLCSDLANLYRNVQAPSANDYNGIPVPTDDPSVTYTEYRAAQRMKQDPKDSTKTIPDVDWGQISTGSYAKLWAQLARIDLKVTATRNGMGQEQASMARTVEVAMIPVFQFGAFSDMDMSLFSSPNLHFQGRLHTNGNLFLGASGDARVIFHDKLTAYGEIIRTVTPNNLPANNAQNDDGTVVIPRQPSGCDNVNFTGTLPSTCRAMGQSPSEGSVRGTDLNALSYNGHPGYSPDWQNEISTATNYYGGMVTNGNWGGSHGSGVQKLTLPFVGGGALPYELIRRPPPTEDAASTIGASREYNLAEIRILFDDDVTQLRNGAGDPENVRLANLGAYLNGVPITGTAYNTYFAEAAYAVPNPNNQNNPTNISALPADWRYRPKIGGDTSQTGIVVDPYIDGPNGNFTASPGDIGVCRNSGCAYPYYTAPAGLNHWRLMDGYLRVEYVDANRVPHGVTREWLGLGFARNIDPPKPGAPNDIHPNAILLLQKLADRNFNGTLDETGNPPTCSSNCGQTSSWKYAKPPEVVKDGNTGKSQYTRTSTPLPETRYNWYPLNFYDPREGEQRDVPQGSANYSCTAMGIMNAVELDVGNLKQWLGGTIGANGGNVDKKSHNGYILYFSDRRGMRTNPNGTTLGGNANTRTGDSGLEDVIVTDGGLYAPGGNRSAEDVNGNGQLDNFGQRNIGLGFYDDTDENTNVNAKIISGGGGGNPYYRIAKTTTAFTGGDKPCVAAGKTWVSGARHVLKLVDGGFNGTDTNLPRPGFTVASENPLYIQGDYNSYVGDTTWTGGANPTENTTHAAASVIADAVTLLSNGWVDRLSLQFPATGVTGSSPPANNRPASSTYFRTAVAGGKNKTFQAIYPSGDTNWSFGTDGGLHNFLRFLEDWSNDSLNYKGSMVSLYYSTYATGLFKCCGYTVYRPPTRNYVFDQLFAKPEGLPPGTPMFRDVEKTTYSQYLDARSY